MTTTAGTATDIFSAWDQYDVDDAFVPAQATAPAVETVEAPAVVTCKGCGRPLRATKSRALGRGPVCQAKFAARVATAAATEPADRVAKAVELIEDGGLVRVGHDLYLATSSNGSLRYEVTPTGECSCTAAQYGRGCYHSLAARIA